MNQLSTPVAEKKGTFILFSTTKNLTKTDLKKTFNVKKGNLVLIKRKHIDEGYIFDQLFAIKTAAPNDGIYHNYEQDKFVTHIYSVKQNTCAKDFALMKYGAELLGGFDVCHSDLMTLTGMIESYRQIAYFCSHGKNSLKSLERQATEMSEHQIGPDTQFQNQLQDVINSIEDFSHPKLIEFKEKIDDWFESHKWKDAYSESDAQNDQHNILVA